MSTGGVIEERGRDVFHGGMSRDSPQTILAISESRGGMEMMAFMILHMPMMRIICPCVVKDINLIMGHINLPVQNKALLQTSIGVPVTRDWARR